MVKQIFHYGLMATLAMAQLSASAAITDVKHLSGDRFNFIPPVLTAGNEVRCVIATESSDGDDDAATYKFTIFDKSLQVVKTIETPKMEVFTAKGVRYEALRGPIGVHVNHISQSDEINMSKNEWDAFINSEGLQKVEFDGKTVYARGDYWYSEFYGTKYPTSFCTYDSVKGVATWNYVEYLYDDWGFMGKYSEEGSEYTNTRSTSVCLLDARYGDGTETDSFYLTQTLFNDDEEYEWIENMMEKISVNREDKNNRTVGEEIRNVGFRVMTEKGKVAEVKYPAGYYSIYDDFSLLIIDDKNYLCSEVKKDTAADDEYYSIIYEVTKTGASVQMVGEPIKVKVSPTGPRRGTPVEVEIGETVGQRCSVAVVSASGQCVMKRDVAPGTAKTSIDTASMQQGVYVVTVTDERGTRNATKIVVR